MLRATKIAIYQVLALLLRLSKDIHPAPERGHSFTCKGAKMKELNIYDNKGNIVKTYKTEYIYISTGIVEDIFKLVDIDKLLSKGTTQEELGAEMLKIVVKGWSNFKQIIMQIFDGLTEEEFKNTRLNEIVSIIFYILNNALSSLNNIGTNEKK